MTPDTVTITKHPGEFVLSEKLSRRVRRTRKYGGWRARLAGWLRALSEKINPLL